MDPDRTEQPQSAPAADRAPPAALRPHRQSGNSGALLLFVLFLAIAAILVAVSELRNIASRS